MEQIVGKKAGERGNIKNRDSRLDYTTYHEIIDNMTGKIRGN